jgi:hypothetical protein
MATVHAAILFPVRQPCCYFLLPWLRRHLVSGAVSITHVAVTSLFPARQPYLPNYKTLSRQNERRATFGSQTRTLVCHSNFTKPHLNLTKIRNIRRYCLQYTEKCITIIQYLFKFYGLTHHVHVTVTTN